MLFRVIKSYVSGDASGNRSRVALFQNWCLIKTKRCFAPGGGEMLMSKIGFRGGRSLSLFCRGYVSEFLLLGRLCWEFS